MYRFFHFAQMQCFIWCSLHQLLGKRVQFSVAVNKNVGDISGQVVDTVQFDLLVFKAEHRRNLGSHGRESGKGDFQKSQSRYAKGDLQKNGNSVFGESNCFAHNCLSCLNMKVDFLVLAQSAPLCETKLKWYLDEDGYYPHQFLEGEDATEIGGFTDFHLLEEFLVGVTNHKCKCGDKPFVGWIRLDVSDLDGIYDELVKPDLETKDPSAFLLAKICEQAKGRIKTGATVWAKIF